MKISLEDHIEDLIVEHVRALNRKNSIAQPINQTINQPNTHGALIGKSHCWTGRTLSRKSSTTQPIKQLINQARTHTRKAERPSSFFSRAPAAFPAAAKPHWPAFPAPLFVKSKKIKRAPALMIFFWFYKGGQFCSAFYWWKLKKIKKWKKGQHSPLFFNQKAHVAGRPYTPTPPLLSVKISLRLSLKISSKLSLEDLIGISL